jgi:hypothetical protein
MKSLIWKECHENLKWAVLPAILIFAPMGLSGAPGLLDTQFLYYVTLVSAVFGAALGFLQVFPESGGDKRALLLHRPLSRSRIFLAKALAGAGIYLVAVGLPIACFVGLAATPDHVAEPFGWPMVLPMLADMLAGLVYYFAGMLTAQREARWFGSRCLGLAAGVFCSITVWVAPEFWQALLVIFIMMALAGTAAWGSFLAGGVNASQPRLAKAALGTAFLTGLLALGFVGKVFLGAWLNPMSHHWYELDRQGNVLLLHYVKDKSPSATYVQGDRSQQLKGERLERVELDEIRARRVEGPLPKTISYRNKNRFLVQYSNRTRPGNEVWWYVPDKGRTFGYDKQTNRLVGSFGPDGFARPEQQSPARFQGELAYLSAYYYAQAGPYLAFSGGVYDVDFRALSVRPVFVPKAGEKVVWSTRWEAEAAPGAEQPKPPAVLVLYTDRSVHIVNEADFRVLVSAPLAQDSKTYRIWACGRLENPQRYWLWYEPAWYLPLDTLENMPARLLFYDARDGKILSQQDVPPQPGGTRKVTPNLPIVDPTGQIAWFGLVTPPAEAAFLLGTMRQLESGVRSDNGADVPLLLRFLYPTTQYFVPGGRWDLGAHASLVLGFAALMLASSVVCALVCFLIPGRYAFSLTRRAGWSLCGFLFGPTGLLLMLALQEWPARIPCPKCRRLRVVTRDTCEHCGAPHFPPEADGTEIMEPTRTAVQAPMAALSSH